MKPVKQILAVGSVVAAVVGGFASILPAPTSRISLQELKLVRELKANPSVLIAKNSYINTSNNMYGSDGTTYIGTSNNLYGSDGSTSIGGGSVSFVEKVLRKGKLPAPVVALR
jgi:gas vesicle protein